MHATGDCAVNGQSLAQDAGVELTDIRVTVRDWASACALVREGMGIAVVPESMLPADRKGLRVLPFAPSIDRRFGLVAPNSLATNLPLNTFWQHVAKATKQE
ncbi:LysR family transcriptional regulator substrate-binding protein [Chromohalobacter nigrandesensis]|uniref:LysR family transcriptional regulator substrate-binding protein n=1 Tax=Chromohalobacter nigrandesensis TaxID=119863 RepID=UPI003CCFEDDC